MRFLKYLTAALVFLFIVTQSFADDVGNWTETFKLKGDHWVLHTPQYLNLDGWMHVGSELNMSAGSVYNDLIIAGCGLHLKVKESRADFVKALTCSGLYHN